jgi:hypothetical protein
VTAWCHWGHSAGHYATAMRDLGNCFRSVVWDSIIDCEVDPFICGVERSGSMTNRYHVVRLTAEADKCKVACQSDACPMAASCSTFSCV